MGNAVLCLESAPHMRNEGPHRDDDGMSDTLQILMQRRTSSLWTREEPERNQVDLDLVTTERPKTGFRDD